MQSIEWRAVVGYEGLYEVSSEGTIRRIAKARGTRAGRVSRAKPSPDGRIRVDLTKDGKVTKYLAHRVVAIAFLGPPKPGLEVCHNDGNCQNNRVENLRWDTRSANQMDLVRHGGHNNAKKTHCPYGHEYNAENTRISGTGSRVCRACFPERRKRRQMISAQTPEKESKP